MGYTHYFNQKRNFTKVEWSTVCDDVRAILTYAQHDCGIALANGAGDGGTSPEITPQAILFNGVGADSYETMYFTRVRTREHPGQKDIGRSFCKTERKPYDPVVVAVLCYLSTATRREDPATNEPIIGSEVFDVSSDGDGSEFLAGLDLARKALPRIGNVIDLPMVLMKSDRWCAPWINQCKGYEVRFCIDGKGYVLRERTGESYCFESHMALAQFLESTKRVDLKHNYFVSWGNTGRRDYYPVEPNIWSASGSFDKARHERLERAQRRVLEKLFPVDAACAQQPPAYVRPGQMPDNAGRKFCYSIGDLLNLAQGA